MHRLPTRERDPRPTASQRGYDYDWIRYRDEWWKRHPYAVCACGCGTPVHAGNADLDHIIPLRLRPDLRLDDSNIQPLLHGHHSIKTRRQSRQWRGGQKV